MQAPSLASIAVSENPTARQNQDTNANPVGTKRKRHDETESPNAYASKHAKIVNDYYEDQRRKEKLECIKVRLQIMAYVARFKELLQDMVKNLDWDTMNLQDHLALLEQIEFTVANRGAGVIEEEAAEVVLGLIQTGASTAGLQVNGPDHYLTDLAKDPSFKDTVAEVQLKYMQLIYMNPLARLAAQVGHGIMHIHEANKLAQQAKNDGLLAYNREQERQASLNASVHMLNAQNIQ